MGLQKILPDVPLVHNSLSRQEFTAFKEVTKGVALSVMDFQTGDKVFGKLGSELGFERSNLRIRSRSSEVIEGFGPVCGEPFFEAIPGFFQFSAPWKKDCGGSMPHQGVENSVCPRCVP